MLSVKEKGRQFKFQATYCGTYFCVCGWNPKVWPFNEIYWALLSCDAVNNAVQGGFNFWVCGWNPEMLEYSDESYCAMLSWNAVYFAVQGGSNVCVYGCYAQVWPFKWKLFSVLLIMIYKVVLSFELVDVILKPVWSLWSHFFEILFVMLCKVTLILDSVDEILKLLSKTKFRIFYRALSNIVTLAI